MRSLKIGFLLSCLGNISFAIGQTSVEYNFGSIYPNVAKGQSGDFCWVQGSNSNAIFDSSGNLSFMSGLTLLNSATPNNLTQYVYYYGAASFQWAKKTVSFDLENIHRYAARTINFSSLDKTVGPLGNVSLKFIAEIGDCKVPVVAFYHATSSP